MRTPLVRSIMTLSAALIAVMLLWLFFATAATPYPIVYAEPAGGVVGTGTPASCTEAALDAKLSGGGTITFNCGTNPHTITLSNTKTITLNTTLEGGGKITLSGGNTTRLLVVQSGATLTVKNLTLADGRDSFGGCVADLGAFEAYNTVLRNCHSVTKQGAFFPPYGGAIVAWNANLYLSNTQVLNNSADLYGGGIYLLNSVGQLDSVNVLTNTAWFTYTSSGGGIYADNQSLLNIYNSHIDGNRMGYRGEGGGIAAISGTLQLFNVTLNNNYGLNAATGGGLYAQGSTVVLDQVTASGNHGVYAGGGLTSESSAITVTNSSFSNNVASSNGGGIDTYKGSLWANNTFVNTNLVDSDGGGISLYQTPTTLINVTVNNNTGGRSGAGIDSYRSTLTLDRVTVSGNVNNGEALAIPEGDGGGIYNSDGTLIVTNSTIDHNTSTGTAGGLYNTSDSTMILTNVTLSANAAAKEGGGLYNETSFSTNSSIITLTNVTLKDNLAANGGGLFNGSAAKNLIYVKNTIIADSAGGNCAGKAVATAKYSLSTDTTCTLSGTGNVSNVEAHLFPLLNNGGSTNTHLPSLASPAVNGVFGADFPLSDQRGVARPQGVGADIGAVERQAADPAVAPWLYLPSMLR